MISCQELSTAIASDKLEGAGWRQRLGIRFHLMICKHCRCYARQMKALGGVMRRLAGKDERACQDLEQKIIDRCCKGPPD